MREYVYLLPAYPYVTLPPPNLSNVVNCLFSPFLSPLALVS